MGRRKKDEWDEDDGVIVSDESREVSDKSLHDPRFGQSPVQMPIRWIDHADDMPYLNPELEFIRSPFPISLNELAARWEGLYRPHEIEQGYAEGNWAFKRTAYWEKVNAEVLDSYRTEDVEFQKRILKDDVRRFGNLLDRLEGDIIKGVEIQKIRGGGSFGYVKMPLTVESATKLANAMVNVSNLRATRVNIATQISRDEKDVGPNLKSILDQRRATEDEKYREILEVAKLGGRMFDSSPTEPGVPIKDVTAEAKALPLGLHRVEDEELVEARKVADGR